MINICSTYFKLTFLVLILVSYVESSNAQYAMGNAGMLNTPSAEMHETGTFVIGGNYLPRDMVPFDYNTGNYFVGITLFSFLELTYRPTLLRIDYMRDEPKLRQQDRSLSVRLRAIKESKYIPAIVLGCHDITGTKFYQGYFGVMTKHFYIGGNEIGVSAGYLGHTGDFNKLNDGVFGGVTFKPAFYRDLSFIAEYDTRAVNVGVAARLWKHLSIHAFTSGFKCLSGGLRYECTLIH